MNKNKFQILIIIALVISNLLMLAFIGFSNKPNRFHPEGPKNIIIERLEFNDDQVKEYETMIKKHQASILKKDKEIILLKNNLYSTLQQDFNPILVDSLTKNLAQVQKEIEDIHYHHFLEIKKICKDDQLDKFSDLANELAKIFAPHPKRK
ncbi:MAG: hypothetical protein AB7O47_02980 [Flavobacteriales bacterium]